MVDLQRAELIQTNGKIVSWRQPVLQVERECPAVPTGENQCCHAKCNQRPRQVVVPKNTKPLLWLIGNQLFDHMGHSQYLGLHVTDHILKL
jgi:hypothetical protein